MNRLRIRSLIVKEDIKEANLQLFQNHRIYRQRSAITKRVLSCRVLLLMYRNEIAYIKENPLKKSELDLHLPTSLIKEDFKIASLSEITMKTISINNKGNGLIFPDIKSRHR